MKKKIILPLCMIALLALAAGIVWIICSKEGITIAIDEQIFPDENFRAYVSETYDTDHDGILTADERRAVKDCLVSQKEIHSLRGIEYFPNLEKLDCSLNPIRKLNVSKNTRLKHLHVKGAVISLQTLNWHEYGPLVMLDVTGCKELIELDCSCNSLINLDLSGCPKLGYLDCSFNPLMSLDVHGKKEVEVFGRLRSETDFSRGALSKEG